MSVKVMVVVLQVGDIYTLMPLLRILSTFSWLSHHPKCDASTSDTLCHSMMLVLIESEWLPATYCVMEISGASSVDYPLSGDKSNRNIWPLRASVDVDQSMFRSNDGQQTFFLDVRQSSASPHTSWTFISSQTCSTWLWSSSHQQTEHLQEEISCISWCLCSMTSACPENVFVSDSLMLASLRRLVLNNVRRRPWGGAVTLSMDRLHWPIYEWI